MGLLLALALCAAEPPPDDLPPPAPPPLVDAPAPLTPPPRPPPTPRDDAPSATSRGLVDASQIGKWFAVPSLRVDPALLATAPTSPEGAFLASGATVVTGLAVLIGTLAVSATGFLTPTRVMVLGFATGIALTNFGPNVGDLLNGDWRRFLLMGLGRLALLALTPVISVLAVAGWMVWLAWDVAQSRHAPLRWVEREAPPGL